MKHIRYTRLAAGLLVCLLFGLLWLFTAHPAESARQAQEGLPTYGWEVCADYGVGPVPGLGENRQRFALCHADGWKLQAYCLDPGVDAPPAGRICQRIDADRYWCGDTVQRLAEYGVIETPGPTDTPTPTASATSTSTPTATQTPTVTASATSILTDTPTATPTSSITPMPTSTPQEQRFDTPTPTPARARPTATPYKRPRPGGPGNANLVMGFGLGGLALVSAGWAALRLRRR